jgi:hypothetical protein
VSVCTIGNIVYIMKFEIKGGIGNKTRELLEIV